MATRAENLTYLYKRSGEVMKGPVYYEAWHYWAQGGRWRTNRKRRKFDRTTIRKLFVE